MAEAVFLEAESEKYGGDVVFAKEDIKEMANVATESDITVTPTFQLYKNGELVSELKGVKDATPKAVIAMIDNQLKADALES